MYLRTAWVSATRRAPAPSACLRRTLRSACTTIRCCSLGRLTETPEYNRTARQHTAFEGLARSGLTAVFDNMMDGTACITGNAPWRWNDIIADLGMRLSDIAHQDYVTVGRTVNDILAAHDAGQLALVFGLESADPIENEIDRIDILYGLGIRQLGITYSQSNALGAGLNETTGGGLTELRQARRRAHEQARHGHRRVALHPTRPASTSARCPPSRCC